MWFAGLSFQNSPDVFEFLNAFRRATCEKTVTSEIIPLWFKQPGLKEKLGIVAVEVFTTQRLSAKRSYEFTTFGN